MTEGTKPEEKQKKEVKNEKEDDKTDLVNVRFTLFKKSIVLFFVIGNVLRHILFSLLIC